MKRFALTIAFALLLASESLAANVDVYTGATGRTDLAIKVRTATNTWVSQSLTEGNGSSNGSRVGQYFVTEAQLVSAGVNTASTGNGFVCVIEDANGPVTGSFNLPWSGSAELITPADATAWANAATAANDIALKATLAKTTDITGFTDLTAAQMWAALVSGLTTPDSIGELIVDNLDAKVSEASGGGTVIPTNQTRIPPARKWTLTPDGDDGLIGDKTIAIKGLTPRTFSVDFVKDLATNGQLIGIDEVRIVTVDGEDVEDDSGLTFDEEWQGVDGSEAKLKITPVAEGTYGIAVTASYDDNDGGGSSTGIVTLKVTELPEAP